MGFFKKFTSEVTQTMKKLILSLLLAAPLAATAAGPELQGTVFDVDTISHCYIGPGVTQTRMRMHIDGRSFLCSVLDMDRAKATDVVPQVIIGRDSCNTAETVSSMAARHTTADRQVLAGINGDFFITSGFSAGHEFGNAILGYPNVTCAIDSKLAAPDIIDIGSRENCLIMAKDNWYIDATDLRYRLLNNDGSTVVDAAAVNYPRRAGEMVVYNSFAGKYTSTDQSGRELVLQLAPGSKWAMNKSVKFIVDGSWRQGGCSAIPADGIVISCGPNYSNAFIDGLKDGDVVKLKIVCSLPAFGGIKPDITDIIGGDVRILKENVTTTEAIRWINTPTAHYSRTLAGYDKERTHMVLCCVDQGAGGSGVSYFEAADLMRWLGCWDALDLDGGGSTEMWSASHGIVNTMRDGAERAVGNALFFTLKAPADKTVTSIRFADHRAVLPRYGLYTPVVYGYNQYGQLVDTDLKGFTLSADDALGEITDEGAALLATGEGSHLLTATLGEMTASVVVTIDASQAASPALSEFIVDQYHSWPVELQAKVGNKTMPVDPRAYAWTSDNAAVATVDSDGKVTGVADGTATISGTSPAGDVAVTVTVQCPKAHLADIAPGAAVATDWKLSKISVSTASLSPLGDNGGFALNFKVTSLRGSQLTASRKIAIWGLPDALEFTVNPGDKALKSITLSSQPASATSSSGVVKTVFPECALSQDNVINIPIAELCENTAASYPLTFNSLRFDIAAAGEYHIEVKGLRAVYNNFAGIADIVADSTPQLVLTVVDGQVAIPFVAERLEARDLTGRLVASADGASSLQLAPGFYIITARTLSAKLRL